MQTVVADIGGVNFTQAVTLSQPQDGGGKLTFDGVDADVERVRVCIREIPNQFERRLHR